jgi:hypothetical protein
MLISSQWSTRLSGPLLLTERIAHETVAGDLTAVRDFDLAYVGSGSTAAETNWRDTAGYVRFTPKSGQTGNGVAKSALCQKRTFALQQIFLFDHLVGAE